MKEMIDNFIKFVYYWWNGYIVYDKVKYNLKDGGEYFLYTLHRKAKGQAIKYRYKVWTQVLRKNRLSNVVNTRRNKFKDTFPKTAEEIEKMLSDEEVKY